MAQQRRRILHYYARLILHFIPLLCFCMIAIPIVRIFSSHRSLVLFDSSSSSSDKHHNAIPIHIATVSKRRRRSHQNPDAPPPFLVNDNATSNNINSANTTTTELYRNFAVQRLTTTTTTRKGRTNEELAPGGRDGDGDRDRTSTKPVFILHVGPPKTGTTFLQCALCSRKKSAKVLELDNYVYIGTCPTDDCDIVEDRFRYLSHKHSNIFPRGPVHERGGNHLGPSPHRNVSLRALEAAGEIPTIAAPFVNAANAAYTQKRNAIFVLEGCHRINSKLIAALAKFLNPRWNVRVVLVYRRLMEWLPSRYNTLYKPISYANSFLWPNEKYAGIMRGDKMPRPFDLSDRAFFSGLVLDIEARSMHPVETARNNYLLRFDDVAVVDLHRLGRRRREKTSPGGGTIIDPYLEHLFCSGEVVPNANNTCSAIRSSAIGNHSATNPSISFDYDILAVTAYDRGLIRQDASRYEVAEALYERDRELLLNKTTGGKSDLPLACLPNRTLERLYNMSLMAEKSLFRRDTGWTSRREERELDHRRAFEKAVATKTSSPYCWVNATKALSEVTAVREFILRLNRTLPNKFGTES